MIHSSAVIHPSSTLASNVRVGPYAYVGPGVKIARDSRVDSFAVIHSNTSIDSGCTIHSYASVGGDPMDMFYHQGDQTYLHLGKNVVVHPFCTINRGTLKQSGLTLIGDNSTLMSYSHIAHDCIVGENVRVKNGASLAGHVKVDSNVCVGEKASIAQYRFVGEYSIIRPHAYITRDILPYIVVNGKFSNQVECLNLDGLEKAEFDLAKISNIKNMYIKIYHRGYNVQQAIACLGCNDLEVTYVQLIKSLDGVLI